MTWKQGREYRILIPGVFEKDLRIINENTIINESKFNKEDEMELSKIETITISEH